MMIPNANTYIYMLVFVLYDAQIHRTIVGQTQLPVGRAQLDVNAHGNAVIRLVAMKRNLVKIYAAHVAIGCANERYSDSIDAIVNLFGVAMLHVIRVQNMPMNIIANDQQAIF